MWLDGIDQIKRLRQVDFLEQVVGEASGVGRLQDEVVAEVASDGEIHDMGVRSLQAVVDAPCDRQTISVGISRKECMGNRGG